MQTLTGCSDRSRGLSRALATTGAWFASLVARAYGLLLQGRSATVYVRFQDPALPDGKRVPIRVFWDLPKWSYPRGGVCIGNVFLTGKRPGLRVLQHEARHVLQWKRYGLAMPILYWLAGSDPRSNHFEVQAGLRDGGYLR